MKNLTKKEYEEYVINNCELLDIISIEEKSKNLKLIHDFIKLSNNSISFLDLRDEIGFKLRCCYIEYIKTFNTQPPADVIFDIEHKDIIVYAKIIKTKFSLRQTSQEKNERGLFIYFDLIEIKE